MEEEIEREKVDSSSTEFPEEEWESILGWTHQLSNVIFGFVLDFFLLFFFNAAHDMFFYEKSGQSNEGFAIFSVPSHRMSTSKTSRGI